MQYSQPGYAYTGPPNTTPLYGYPEILGEGNLASVVSPNGSIQLVFLPTSQWSRHLPYQTPQYTNNANAAWIIRSVLNPAQPTFYQQPQTGFQQVQNNTPSQFSPPPNPPPTGPFELKFHNDTCTSTSDISHFYPVLRNCDEPTCFANLRKRPSNQLVAPPPSSYYVNEASYQRSYDLEPMDTVKTMSVSGTSTSSFDMSDDDYARYKKHKKKRRTYNKCDCKAEMIKRKTNETTCECKGEMNKRKSNETTCECKGEMNKRKSNETTCECKGEMNKRKSNETTCECKGEMNKRKSNETTCECKGEMNKRKSNETSCECKREMNMRKAYEITCDCRAEMNKRKSNETTCECKGEMNKRKSNETTCECKGEMNKRKSNETTCECKGEMNKRKSNETTCECKGEMNKRKSNETTYECKGEMNKRKSNETTCVCKGAMNKRKSNVTLCECEAAKTKNRKNICGCKEEVDKGVATFTDQASDCVDAKGRETQASLQNACNTQTCTIIPLQKITLGSSVSRVRRCSSGSSFCKNCCSD